VLDANCLLFPFHWIEISSWPSLKTLFLLRLWLVIFSCSDFRHVVMTPAVLLICEYLMRCPILSGRDVALGSFLCSMLLSVRSQTIFLVQVVAYMISFHNRSPRYIFDFR